MVGWREVNYEGRVIGTYFIDQGRKMFAFEAGWRREVERGCGGVMFIGNRRIDAEQFKIRILYNDDVEKFNSPDDMMYCLLEEMFRS